MANEKVSSLSKARSYEEMAEFWDTHSLADYWKQTHEVEFKVRAERRWRVTLDPDIYSGMTTAEILEACPELEQEDIAQALHYAI